jgi:hypothetical protein
LDLATLSAARARLCRSLIREMGSDRCQYKRYLCVCKVYRYYVAS